MITMKTLATPEIDSYIKPIYIDKKIIIGATDGSGTIAKAEDTFSGWIDPRFVKYDTIVKGQPTKEMTVKFFEVVKEGTFEQIFGSFGKNLDCLCLSQDQIICFVKENAKWLRADSYSKLFLFKSKNELFYVASVYCNNSGFGVGLYRLSFCDNVWWAGYRFRIVVPQL